MLLKKYCAMMGRRTRGGVDHLGYVTSDSLTGIRRYQMTYIKESESIVADLNFKGDFIGQVYYRRNIGYVCYVNNAGNHRLRDDGSLGQKL